MYLEICSHDIFKIVLLSHVVTAVQQQNKFENCGNYEA